jgi:aspartate/methionine/tyrosine aminotransferase
MKHSKGLKLPNQQPINLGLGVISSSSVELSEDEDYSPQAGLLKLRASIANQYGQSVENICITSGASMGLAAAIAQLEPKGEILCPKPYYLSYPELIKTFGHKPVFYNISPEFVSGAPALSEELFCSSTRALIINNPSNPTGQITPNSYFASVARLVRERNIQIISDEVASEFSYDSAVIPDPRIIFPQEQVISLQSFSKSFALPGVRVGYIKSSAAMTQRIATAHWKLTLGTSVGGQSKVLRVIQSEGWQRPQKLLGDLIQRRSLARSILGSSISCPEGGIFALVKTPFKDSRAMCLYLAKQHSIVTTPGHLFGVPTAFRISLGAREEPLEAALKQIHSFLDELKTVDKNVFDGLNYV